MRQARRSTSNTLATALPVTYAIPSAVGVVTQVGCTPAPSGRRRAISNPSASSSTSSPSIMLTE